MSPAPVPARASQSPSSVGRFNRKVGSTGGDRPVGGAAAGRDDPRGELLTPAVGAFQLVGQERTRGGADPERDRVPEDREPQASQAGSGATGGGTREPWPADAGVERGCRDHAAGRFQRLQPLPQADRVRGLLASRLSARPGRDLGQGVCADTARGVHFGAVRPGMRDLRASRRTARPWGGAAPPRCAGSRCTRRCPARGPAAVTPTSTTGGRHAR